MYKHEYITQAQLNEALEDDVYSRVLATNPVGTSLSTTSSFTDEFRNHVAIRCSILCRAAGATAGSLLGSVIRRSNVLKLLSSRDT